MSALLELAEVSKRFAGLLAVDSVSFVVPRGSIVGLIGPNGAGKTTIFNLIAGVFRPDRGRILFDGREIGGLKPHVLCRAGVARTFQIARPFGALSTLENTMVGAFRAGADTQAAEKRARAVLERLGLAEKAHAPAHGLTLPERRRLEVARALATEPKLLLLDEAMAGLRPIEVDAMVGTLAELVRESGLTILLTEHVMRAVMSLSHHIVVVHHGQKIAEGTPEHVAADARVIECYFGRSAH